MWRIHLLQGTFLSWQALLMCAQHCLGGPAVEHAGSPCESAGRILCVVAGYCELLLCWGLLRLFAVVLAPRWACSGSAKPLVTMPRAPSQRKPHAFYFLKCMWIRYIPGPKQQSVFLFRKNRSGESTVALRWRSAFQANFRWSLMCKGEAV